MITRFKYWEPSTWTIPKMYWDAFSQEQRIHAICKMISKLIAYADYLGVNVDELADMQAELESEFEKFKESGYEDYYKTQVEQWVKDNLDTVFEQYTRGVYFGLNQEGYFISVIPESWSDVVFDTGADYSLNTYGRLILRMDVDSPYSVDQEPEPNYVTYSQVKEIADNALSLATTNEQDIGTNDGEIAMLANNTGVSVTVQAAESLDARITALENA